MVGNSKIGYFEGECFRVEIGLTSEHHGFVDLPEGNSLKPGYDSVERGTRWSYRCPWKSHGIIGLNVEKVEATPAIHEDSRQVGLANDYRT